MARTKTVQSLDDLTEGMFEHFDTGRLRGGLQWLNTSDGPLLGECYQYTFEELLEIGHSWQGNPEITEFRIVTHAAEYKKMRVLYSWIRSKSLTNSSEAAIITT